jgi:hypothetical protein
VVIWLTLCGLYTDNEGCRFIRNAGNRMSVCTVL